VSEEVRLRDGEIILYKRERSSLWQARIKTPEGKWKRVSTGESDQAAAGRKADDDHQEMRLRVKFGLPGDTRIKFGHAADQYVAKVQAEIDAGTGKAIYPTYVAIVKNWLKPFFGSKPIGEIDDEVISNFDEFRKKKLGAEPAKTTINNHNVVMRAVFDLACKKKWIMRNQVPIFTVKNKGRKQRRRPEFSDSEFLKLIHFTEQWMHKESKNKITRYKRILLYCYIGVLSETGMRPGTEMEDLRWRDVEFFRTPKDQDTYRIWVNRGKTGERRVIAQRTIDLYFDRLRKLTKRKDKDDLLFVMFDGSKPKWLSEMFTNLLIDADMLYHPQTGERRSLYSIRHTYATSMLVEGRVREEVLAKQMGTSTAMIEANYSHLTPTMAADAIIGELEQAKEEDKKDAEIAALRKQIAELTSALARSGE
jgi:integrase